MYDNDVNKLIELIYESAIKPSKWTDLLNSLAEFVDYVEKEASAENPEESLLSVMPSISSIANTENNIKRASISETLKAITSINEEKENPPEIRQVNDLLIGHFSRAIKIAKRLVDVDEQHNVVLSLLDRMPIALILVDAKSQVIETNSLADEMLLSGDGIHVNSNHLDAGKGNNERLFSLIEKMSKHDSAITRGQSLSITNEKTQNNIMLYIAPLNQQGVQQKASVAVFVSQRKSLPLSLPKDFSELYSLTNKEIEITQQLVRGLSVKEISEESTISTHTIRSQVKSVLKKTQTSRQAELVSLVYNGIGDFGNLIPEVAAGERVGILNKSTSWDQDYNVLQLDDGRNLAYAEYGDLNGEPVFHCHSVLGSRLELAFNAIEILKKKTVRLIVMDRPGYGASDYHPQNNFITWVQDLVQLADHLNIKKFSLTGYAMGGIYALACAHEIPERLNGVAIISAGDTPKSSKDYKTIIPLYKMNNRLAKNIPKVYSLLTGVLIKGILTEPATFFSQFSDRLEQSDRDILNSKEFKTEMFSSLTEGLRLGGKAASSEVIQFMHEWGFEVSSIKIPIDIWHGSSDYHVPIRLGKRLAEKIQRTRLTLKEKQGHFMFYTHWSEILDVLLVKKPLPKG